MKKLFITFATVIVPWALFLCGGQEKIFAGQPANDFEEVKTGTIDGVIVSEHKARYFYAGNKVRGYFTPSRDDILKAEAGVIDYLRETTPQQLGYPYAPDLDKKLANYKRQYVGVVLQDKKKIWINFFCSITDDSWKRSPYSMIGGGACYFNVLYDVNSGKFSNLRINGLTIRTGNDTNLPVK